MKIIKFFIGVIAYPFLIVCLFIFYVRDLIMEGDLVALVLRILKGVSEEFVHLGEGVLEVLKIALFERNK